LTTEKLAKGQTVVIHGAGGAVGSTAVQLARWAGAEVIGTGRGHSRPLVLELGADRFVALDADRLEDVAGQADLVFDTIGGEVLARSPALLRPGGRRRHPRPDRPPALTQAPGYRRVKVRWVTPLGLLTASVRKRRSSPSSPSQSGSPRPSTMGTTTMCR
jgi:Zinc-binding dehydrogenase